MPRVAILDDYQGVALEMANWRPSPLIARYRCLETISPILRPWLSA